MERMSLFDLFSYMKILETKFKKEKDSISKNDFMKSLVALRDILNFMTMGKEGIRMKK